MTASDPLRSVSIEERRARLALRHRLAPSTRTDDDVAAIAERSSRCTRRTRSRCTCRRWRGWPVPVARVRSMRALYDDAVDRPLPRDASHPVGHDARRWHGRRTPRRRLKLLAPEHARFVKLLAEPTASRDGDRWIAEAKAADARRALHRRGEATARELGLAVPALRHPMVLAPGKSYSSTQGAHTRVLLAPRVRGCRSSVTRPVGIVGQQPVPVGRRWTTGFPAASPEWTRPMRPPPWSNGGCTASARGPRPTSSGGWDGTGATRSRRMADCRRRSGRARRSARRHGPSPAWLAADDTEVGQPTMSRGSPSCPGLDPTTMGWKRA